MSDAEVCSKSSQPQPGTDSDFECIDTHCHLDFSHFNDDRHAVIDRARQCGVRQMVVVGTDPDSSAAAVRLAQQFSGLFATAGIHPHYAEQATESALACLQNIIRQPAVRAIGEVGLDYFNREQPEMPVDESVRALQRRLLAVCIKLARESGLPLVLHCRQAAEDMSLFLQEIAAAGVVAVVHCFSGDRAFLEQCMAAQAYISFTGNITYPRAESLRDIVRQTPLERMMLETDAPFLAPQPVRGRRNEPAYVRYVAEAVSRIIGKPVAEIAEVTTENARRFFRLGQER